MSSLFLKLEVWLQILCQLETYSNCNELADEAAKSALNLSMSAVKCPALYSDVANHCQHLWQAEWDGCVSNKLHSVKPLLGYSNLSSLSRQDAVVLRRFRIGHTRLTHSYLLNRQDQPELALFASIKFDIQFIHALTYKPRIRMRPINACVTRAA